ncbi:hypothetical protein VFPFJ_03871 [Purpureocillium lilacinum]|uniref:Uncharacterized protein n=1 Tax=Purpureocillium lilacinum TaxID=33203 RepID=A0A179HRF0_PURLI|nr:hypothetical protein VFPFJ_03871 [Purpureocillium lilacinum]OAQ92131.1 hypothetical protein VFPFJ_03871 [Purpureocillium lilacinum]
MYIQLVIPLDRCIDEECLSPEADGPLISMAMTRLATPLLRICMSLGCLVRCGLVRVKVASSYRTERLYRNRSLVVNVRQV